MNEDVDITILQLNFLEFLTYFLEGRIDLSQIFQLNERIYSREHATLSPSLVKVCTDINTIKEALSRGETMDNETIIAIVNDSVLELIEGKKSFQSSANES